jgi:hypothetical protein
MLYVVTVKVEGTPGHDPLNKVTGPCPVSGKPCDDATGKHHSFLVDVGLTVEQVRDVYAEIFHVTRVEEVSTP